MDDSNLPSLHVDTNSLPTPTRGRRRRREPSPSPPLSPASSTHINAHALIHTLHTFYLPLPLPPPHDPPYFCATMNSLSIKRVQCFRRRFISINSAFVMGFVGCDCEKVKSFRFWCIDNLWNSQPPRKRRLLCLSVLEMLVKMLEPVI